VIMDCSRGGRLRHGEHRLLVQLFARAARKPSGKDAGGRGDAHAAKGPARHKQPVVQPKQETAAAGDDAQGESERRASGQLSVKVGDVMPKTDQLDINGKTKSLASLYGKKLTVVCFWTAVDRRSALETANILRSLTSEITTPFAGKGVQVIGSSLRETWWTWRRGIAFAKPCRNCVSMLERRQGTVSRLPLQRR